MNTPHRGDDPLVVLSVPSSSPWAHGLPPDVPGVRLHVRRWRWMIPRWRIPGHVLREAVSVYRAGAGAPSLVVATAGADLILMALLMRLRPSQRLVVYDVLLPRNPRVRRLGRVLLRRVDVWLVIRSGDVATFRRELAARDCRFVPFPAHVAPSVGPEARREVEEPPFVYAAGTAYRDWPTLVEAAVRAQVAVAISTADPVQVPDAGRSLVRVLPLLPPDEGRAMARRATVVCIPLQDTDMPSGPLVVLDAMAAGKAVVASDVNGTRDYVEHAVTGILVPPGDATALGDALARLVRDPGERARLGAAARRTVPQPSDVLREIVDQATSRTHAARR